MLPILNQRQAIAFFFDAIILVKYASQPTVATLANNGLQQY
ncbi:hypothetical protein PB1E_1856 [Leuconostoc gelidum subsp. gasicomitatum]|nr:hypothetical protein PB1E_1856 [Leuconostoc gasicomitatum]